MSIRQLLMRLPDMIKSWLTKFTSQHIKNQAETVVGTIREKEENA